MFSAVIFTAFASSMALRRRGFDSGAPPPCRADIVISRISFVKRRPRLASAAPFLCLIVLHLLWPDMEGIIAISFQPAGRAVGSRLQLTAYSRQLPSPLFSRRFQRQ